MVKRGKAKWNGVEELKLDLGCGKTKKEGFSGIDRIKFEGVDCVCDFRFEKLPFKDDSVGEVHASHVVEHLTADERCHLFNELYRVMKVDAKITMICPYWGSSRAYGDPTHKWPPIGEMWFFYLDRAWREQNAPHTDKIYEKNGYNCHFTSTWGYSLHQQLLTKNDEFKQFAINFYKEAVQDIIATIVKVG